MLPTRSEVDRRSVRRFAMSLDVAYRMFLAQRTVVSEGTVKTIDISSAGVLLDNLRQCPSGSTAELVVDWPFTTQDCPHRRLWLFGWVVRSDGRGTAIKIARYHFERGQAAGHG